MLQTTLKVLSINHFIKPLNFQCPLNVYGDIEGMEKVQTPQTTQKVKHKKSLNKNLGTCCLFKKLLHILLRSKKDIRKCGSCDDK
jgi:hypothetical protein